MLGLLTHSRRPARPASPRPVRPCLERLEARDCPSYVGLNVAYAAGKQITLYGTAPPVTMDNNGQGLSVRVDSSGNFDLCVHLNGTSSDNGNIMASCTDAWGMQSNTPIYDIMQFGT